MVVLVVVVSVRIKQPLLRLSFSSLCLLVAFLVAFWLLLCLVLWSGCSLGFPLKAAAAAVGFSLDGCVDDSGITFSSLPLLLSGILVQYNIRLFAMVYSFVALLIEQIQVCQHGGIQKACKPWNSLVLKTVALLQGVLLSTWLFQFIPLKDSI